MLLKICQLCRYFVKSTDDEKIFLKREKEATRNIRRRSKYHFAGCEEWCSSKTQQPGGISLNYSRSSWLTVRYEMMKLCTGSVNTLVGGGSW